MSKTILLADDSVTIQKVIELTFMDEDYEVIAAGNGDEALEKLEATSPDVVIADVHMPGASGFDVARRSKQLHPGAPVLLLVGTFEPFDDADYAASGADSFLKKPFDSQELLQRVTALLADGPSAAPGAPPPLPDLPPTEAGDALDPAATRAVPRLGGDERVRPVADVQVRPPAEVTAEPFPELAEPRPTVGDYDVFGFAEADGSSQVRPPDEDDEAPAFVETAEGDELVLTANDEYDEFDELDLASADQAEAVPAAAAAEPPSSGVPGPAASNGAGRVDALSDADVDRIARRVVDLLGDQVIREVAWEVVPDLAEVAVRDRLAELEGQIEKS